MKEKVLSVISYLSIIGWIVSYLLLGNKKDDIVDFHLKQSLGLAISKLITYVFFLVLSSIIINLLGINLSMIIIIAGTLVYLFLIALTVIGCINAARGKMCALPIIGGYFVNKFNFIR